MVGILSSAALARDADGVKLWNPRARCAGWATVLVGGIYVVGAPTSAPDSGAALAFVAVGALTVLVGVVLVRGNCLRASPTGLELRRYVRCRRWRADEIEACVARADSNGLIYPRAYLVFTTRGSGDVAFNGIQWNPRELGDASATGEKVMGALRGEMSST